MSRIDTSAGSLWLSKLYPWKGSLPNLKSVIVTCPARATRGAEKRGMDAACGIVRWQDKWISETATEIFAAQMSYLHNSQSPDEIQYLFFWLSTKNILRSLPCHPAASPPSHSIWSANISLLEKAACSPSAEMELVDGIFLLFYFWFLNSIRKIFV